MRLLSYMVFIAHPGLPEGEEWFDAGVSAPTADKAAMVGLWEFHHSYPELDDTLITEMRVVYSDIY